VELKENVGEECEKSTECHKRWNKDNENIKRHVDIGEVVERRIYEKLKRWIKINGGLYRSCRQFKQEIFKK